MQANPVANGRERVVRAELTRLQSNADATGPRYDLRAKPQDARDKTELFVDLERLFHLEIKIRISRLFQLLQVNFIHFPKEVLL